MALLHIPIADIDERQLNWLIASKVSETRDIEYKRDLYGSSDGDHAEWLADASSFANTSGGDLIIGIEAKNGVPLQLAPLSVDIDGEILKLEQIARSSLQPRLSALHFKPIPITGGGHVLLIRVPRSYNPPHRIVRQGKGQNRFWARSSAGKFEPNVDELRLMFTLAPQLAERMRDFRFNRIAKIGAEEIPVQLLHRCRLIMHIVPFSSLDPGSLVSLASIEENPHAFAPIGSNSAVDWRINFDGVLLPSNAKRGLESRAYTQVYRSGRVEAVDSSPPATLVSQDGRPLRSVKIEGKILLSLVKYMKGLQTLGIEPPVALMISLIGTKGALINVGQNDGWDLDSDIATLDRDQYHFGEVILNSVPNSVQECAVIIRPFIEQLANTAGRSISSSFGPNGEYLHFHQ